METIVFFGNVVPERADLTIQNAKRSLEHPTTNKNIGNIQIDIKNSQALVLLTIDFASIGLEFRNMEMDITTLKNLAYDQTKLFINMSAIFLGGGYDIDIVKGLHFGSGFATTFAPRAAPILEFIKQNCRITVDDLHRSTFKKVGTFIQYALEDFSDGLRVQSRNAMFLFYRAIESLRKYAGEKYSISGEGKQWEKLREILSVDRTEIDFIKGFADEVRHGGGTTWQVQDIERAERFVWKAIHDVATHEIQSRPQQP